MRPTAFAAVMLCVSALAAEKLTNADIVTMVHGKVPQDVIIQKIADCEPGFLLDATNLVALVNAGVPDDVIRALTAKQRGQPLPASSPAGTGPSSREGASDERPSAAPGAIRVYVSDSQSWEVRGGWGAAGRWNASGGSWGGSGYEAGGARPQTAEIIKTINQRCPGVTVTNRVERADFAITLDHEGGKALLRRRNKIVVFSRAGDAIFSDSTRELGNSVKDACDAILRNLPQGAAAVTAPPNGLVDVTFSSNPPGARVSFSGMPVCNTPCVVKLEARRFKVTMTLPGYADWTQEFTVESGNPSVVAQMAR